MAYISKDKLKQAIKTVAEQLLNQYGEGELYGFALCTDDSVETLYHAACTKEWTSHHPREYALCPTEWELALENAQAIDEISIELQSWSGRLKPGEEWHIARDEHFEVLVQAMVECQEEGNLSGFAFLCVTSVSALLYDLAFDAVSRLNGEDLADEYRVFFE